VGNLKSRRSSAFFQHPRRCYFHASLQRSVEYIIIDSREKWIKFFSSSKVHSLAFFQSLSFVVSDKVFQYLINWRLGSVKRERVKQLFKLRKLKWKIVCHGCEDRKKTRKVHGSCLIIVCGLNIDISSEMKCFSLFTFTFTLISNSIERFLYNGFGIDKR
jgi:hypothetical protein